MMRPTVSQYAQALQEFISDAKPEKVAEISKNFLAFLKRRGEEGKVDSIFKRLEKMEDEKSGHVTVKAITAHELSESMKSSLVTKAQNIFPGKKIELLFSVDPKIIGGAKLRSDEMLYDASLATAVKKLRTRLSS